MEPLTNAERTCIRTFAAIAAPVGIVAIVMGIMAFSGSGVVATPNAYVGTVLTCAGSAVAVIHIALFIINCFAEESAPQAPSPLAPGFKPFTGPSHQLRDPINGR